MNWFDQWFYRKVKCCWDNKQEFEKPKGSSMKWLGRWLVKIAQQAGEEEREQRIYGTAGTPKLARASDVDGDEGLNISVRNANGGKIISFRHYDSKTDRNTYKLYVIPDDRDFERELGKLITLESMRF